MSKSNVPPPKIFEAVDSVAGADDIAPLSCADALQSRHRKVALFTPALLITHGGFDRDPVIEFDARFPAERDLRPFCVDLRREHEFFFAGLGAVQLPNRSRLVNWDKRLYAIDAERKDECFEFIGGIAFSDPRRGFFAHTFAYDIQIPDPTSKKYDILTVTIFGVLANTFIALLRARLNKPAVAVKIPVSSQVAAAQFLGQQYGIVTPGHLDDPLTQRDL
jgi:hypothetical protein